MLLQRSIRKIIENFNNWQIGTNFDSRDIYRKLCSNIKLKLKFRPLFTRTVISQCYLDSKLKQGLY